MATVAAATVVGIVDVSHVMTMAIVDLQGAHHIEGVVSRPPMVEDQGGTGLGHFLIHLAQKGSMLVVLGDAFWFLAFSVK